MSEKDLYKVRFKFYKTADSKGETPFTFVEVEEHSGTSLKVDDKDLDLSVTNQALCNGLACFAEITFDQEGKCIRPRTEVADGIYCQVEVVVPPLEVRVHPDGKKCGDCLLFSHEKGLEVLNQVHRRYQEDLELRMNQAIVDHMAEVHGAPTLDKDNVGYCPKTSALVGMQTPACEGFKPNE